LSNYYKEFMTDRDIFIVLADENEINGLLVGTPDSSVGRNLFIKHNIIPLGIKALWLCLKLDKQALEKIGKAGRLQKKPNAKDAGRANKEVRLLSICVSAKSKGKGRAEELIGEFEKRLLNAGYDGYALTVYKNKFARERFYRKVGMERCRRIGYRIRI